MRDRRFSEQPWPSEPDPFLVELAGVPPPGRGLDLGSGPGRNSLWPAAEARDMTLLDAPEVALAQADARAEETGTTIDTVHGDVVGRQRDVTALGRHGPPDPDRLLTVERLSQAPPATVSVEVLDQRRRHPDHGRSPTGEAPDVVVLAWATRRIA